MSTTTYQIHCSASSAPYSTSHRAFIPLIPQSTVMKRSSLFGSFKDKLHRSNSNSSRPSSDYGDSLVIGYHPPNNPSSRATRATGATRDDAPPAYTATIAELPSTSNSAQPAPSSQRSVSPYIVRGPSPAPSASSRLSALTASTPEDPYAFLSSFDTIFVIDDSSSMHGHRWEEVRAALTAITPICVSHDKDGIDLYFLNQKNTNLSYSGRAFGRSPAAAAAVMAGKAAGVYTGITDGTFIRQIFDNVQPYGMTPTGTRLNQILKAYLRNYEAAIQANGGDPDGTDIKPINVIVITDGCPSDDPESVLLSVAMRLDKLDAPPHQIGIQFFQVGEDCEATAALRALDDDLSKQGGGVRDMVDTVTFDRRIGGERVLTSEGMLKVVLGAVVKRLDRSRCVEEERRSVRGGLLRP